MIFRARRSPAQWICFVLLMTLAGRLYFGAEPGFRRKNKSERKGSEAIRHNPFLRDLFRERALSMQPGLRENDRSLNSTVDYLLDDFVERTTRLMEKLTADANDLYRQLPEYRRLAAAEGTGPATDRTLFEATRVKAESVKNASKSLESQLDFITQALHLTLKVRAPETRSNDIAQLRDDIDIICSIVERFQKDLNEFLFPKSNTVSLEGLQTASLPVQLRKIERYADRIETLTKRMR